MALKDCRECGQPVSTSAQECIHCGVKNPGGWLSYTGTGCGGCATFLVIIVCLTFLGMCVMAL